MSTSRVLQIVHADETGGVNTLAEALGEALASRGHAVDVAFLFPNKGVGIAGKLAGIARVALLILTGRYDAVFAFQSTGSAVASLVGWLAGCPHRVVHQTALPGMVRPPLRWLDLIVGSAGFCTDIVVNSQATLDAFAGYPAPYRRRLALIEHGVTRPVPARDRAATLARFAVPDDGTILLTVGRMAAQKNHAVMIKALARLPSARLVVAGDGPLRAAGEALGAEFGVADHLHLLGDVGQQDIADLLAASDVFVFPSVWESFGLAAVEAAMAGVPIVASDLPVLREVLANRDTPVRFVASDDRDDWAAAVRSIACGALPGRRPTPADPQGGERYTISRMVDGYDALLRGKPVRSVSIHPLGLR